MGSWRSEESELVMTQTPRADAPATATRRVRWGGVTLALVLLAVVLAVCVPLGMWQWTRASEQGEVRQPLPAAAIADVALPATTLGSELGRQVWVDGTFADADVALIQGREVDGQEAVLVVRAFTVDAAATGTGQVATLPVVVGWLPPDDVPAFNPAAPNVTRIEGYLRSGEGAGPVPDPDIVPPEGSFWADRLSPAVLAQVWDSPMYSGLLTAAEPEDGLRALPEPEPERKLDFRSLMYALEWWLFGAFFTYLALRWIRDNGIVTHPPEESS